MDLCEVVGLPIDPVRLGERAMHCRAYAKALHYKEEEYHNAKEEPHAHVYEALISINNKLQQKEAAAGKVHFPHIYLLLQIRRLNDIN